MTQSAKSYKVLVLEDEGLIARDIAGRLEALGHEVVGIASTAEEAMKQARLCGWRSAFAAAISAIWTCK